ncbi:MAG: hypothetical protein QNK33_09135 [Bacteroidales bacterium]|nr:hypothetical protein [Bacteroidales bacterium]
MEIISKIISVSYYLLVGFIVFLIIRNMIKSKDWKEEILYVVILLPFLLRLFFLK